MFASWGVTNDAIRLLKLLTKFRAAVHGITISDVNGTFQLSNVHIQTALLNHNEFKSKAFNASLA